MCALRSGRREGLSLLGHCSLSLYFKKILDMVSQALLSTGLYPDSLSLPPSTRSGDAASSWQLWDYCSSQGGKEEMVISARTEVKKQIIKSEMSCVKPSYMRGR